MSTAHALAGKPAPVEILIDPVRLEEQYYTLAPEVGNPQQQVSFGTSGHRGTPGNGTFNEAHILAIAQAICDYRRHKDIRGPLFLGKDTHAVSGPAERTALEVLAANEAIVVRQRNDGYTPTPAISRAILVWNQGECGGTADGIVITPSHNPPADGGFKYNPPHGGPAESEVTAWIQNRANALLGEGNRSVLRIPFETARRSPTVDETDFVRSYLMDLATVVDLDAIRSAGVRIGVDPMGGAAVGYWEPLAEEFKLNLTVVNPKVDPRFSFATLDHDGQIRMDCSSPHAMAGLLALRDKFDIAFGTDADADRHGIVTPSHGLMNPNFYLAAAIHYLHTRRPQWPLSAAVGKTIVSSDMIARVVQSVGRRLAEVPVGFKWFAAALQSGAYCFGGEESAGASFLRRDGTVWTTDKDGLLLGLLAAEITARTGLNPAEYYEHLAALLGRPHYRRTDLACTLAEKERLGDINPATLALTELAGDPITQVLTRASENGAGIGGLKVVTANGWFAARPSGTENIIKVYAESFRNTGHLDRIAGEAASLVRQSGRPT
jgi:phosphoglucomutase